MLLHLNMWRHLLHYPIIKMSLWPDYCFPLSNVYPWVFKGFAFEDSLHFVH